MEDKELQRKKKLMIDNQLIKRGITDPRVLLAFRDVPRERFVPLSVHKRSYDDVALPIGYDQTISQPYTTAFVCQHAQLGPGDKVLEVGTGSGFQTAIIALIVKNVVSIERIPQLALGAESALNSLKYNNIKLVVGNGVKGYLKEAPYDCIISSASSTHLSPYWKKQLINGGRIIYPQDLGTSHKLIKVIKRDEVFEEIVLGDFIFVPLINE